MNKPSRPSTIELFKQRMGFAAGHFTIFSATDREGLHGHNYRIYLSLTTEVGENGLTFNYRDYKAIIDELCEQLDELFLLPTRSPHLSFEEDDDYIYAIFNHKRIPFLREDVKLLPLANITVEELSHWFLQALLKDEQQLKDNRLQRIEVKVSSSPGQSGSAVWEQP